MRGPFLILTPVCVFLGMSIVIANRVNVDIYMLALVLLGAVLAHISVNTLNEYLDFRSGLDLTTSKTRFSGGSGALPQNPEMAQAVLTVGSMSLVATLLIGLFFFWKLGPGIIPIGVLGLMLIVTYTGWINKHPFLCLIAPGIGLSGYSGRCRCGSKSFSNCLWNQGEQFDLRIVRTGNDRTIRSWYSKWLLTRLKYCRIATNATCNFFTRRCY